jgi:hypothetical protein
MALADLRSAAQANRDENTAEIDTDMALAEIGEWQRTIIRDWSRYLFPDVDSASALDHLVAASLDAPKVADVMTRMPNAIQERFNSHRGFEGLAREIESL